MKKIREEDTKNETKKWRARSEKTRIGRIEHK